MRRNIEHLRYRFAGAGRVIAAVLAVLIIFGFLLHMATAYSYVTINIDDGQKLTLLTKSRNLNDVLADAGITLSENDSAVYKQGPRFTANLEIETAFPVSITADGKTFTEDFRDGTVADLLSASGIKLDGEDFVEPELGTPLARGLTAQVHRVTYSHDVRREEPDPALIATYVQTLENPDDFVVSHDDNYEVTYLDRMVDGKIVSSEIIDMVPMVTFLKTRPKDSFTFEAGVPNSRIEGFEDIKVGPDGIPLNYTGKWDSAVCTAYSASRGRGSSGLGLYCGTVAVNPNRIPYGSRMYITSADGSFIYGFAIATDTGTAMMEGYVDIDLFFETNAECRKFGKRNLVVYFLD